MQEMRPKQRMAKSVEAFKVASKQVKIELGIEESASGGFLARAGNHSI